MGLNITPYDNDNTAAAGTTTLRHIDAGQTRLAWSAFGSVQSEPVPLGPRDADRLHAAGGPPDDAARRRSVASPLNGADSPQTIAQSARDGVPIAGRVPAPPDDRITRAKATLDGGAAEIELTASGAGRAHGLPLVGREGLHPGLDDELLAGGRPAAGLRADAVRADRRRRARRGRPT